MESCPNCGFVMPLPAREAADLLGVSDDTIRRWAAEGALKGAEHRTVPGGSRWEFPARPLVCHGLNALLMPLGVSVLEGEDQEILIVAPGILKQAVLTTRQGLQLLQAPKPRNSSDVFDWLEQSGGEIWRYQAGTRPGAGRTIRRSTPAGVRSEA